MFSDEYESSRLRLLYDLKPLPEDVKRAVSGDTTAHPLLRFLLAKHHADLLYICGKRAPAFVLPVAQRLLLSHHPFTIHALQAAIDAALDNA